MDEHERDDHEREPTNLQVVAGGALAAGVVAGIVAAIGRRNRPPAAMERIVPEDVEPTLAAAAGRAREIGRRVAGSMPDNAERFEEQARSIADATKRQAARVTAAVDRDALSDAGAKVDRFGRSVGRAAERRARTSAKKGRSVRNQATKQARRATDQTASAAHAIAAQVAVEAVATAERARDYASSLAQTAMERVPDLTGKIEGDIVPSLREAARRGASSGADLWRTARDGAVAAVPSVELGRARARVGETHTAHMKRAAKEVEKGRQRAKKAAKSTTDERSDLVDRVRSAPRRAASATIDTGRETGAMLLWGGAGAALAYYALLTPERRTQVNQVVQTAATQVQELIGDFRGYDDEF